MHATFQCVTDCGVQEYIDSLMIGGMQQSSLDHFQASFIILVVGAVVSVAAYAYEIVAYRATSGRWWSWTKRKAGNEMTKAIVVAAGRHHQVEPVAPT